jgi:hypothetical protein
MLRAESVVVWFSLWNNFVVSYLYNHNIGCDRWSLFAKKRSKTPLVEIDDTIASELLFSSEQNVALLTKSLEKRIPALLDDLQRNGYAFTDNLLGSKICDVYRREAAGIYERNEMTVSKSTRWNAETNSVVTYDKHNVFSTQLIGGDMYYKSPRLHEYVVTLVKTVVPHVLARFPESKLSSTMASNKLAVCTGDGSYYDKHYDNSGGDDLRKLTILYYMNPGWRPELGGCFRIYKKETDGAEEIITDIEPRGDRLFMFWSDRLVHSVMPTQVLF